ncbi:RluA family pseudouridine synthase [Adonisia turfae]|uniref:RNA pseudouridylate synthase n=1 Tax=Adonisia turfae CCMR0081 TaxID=2292702 RepID=A0A6M0RR44_9CYAN|nr:RluA family pseudouridine synthase [Adonisia turfae]NEZ58263.1 RluA family pseudouridine synthase [Adonisia turfae CCMR0081]
MGLFLHAPSELTVGDSATSIPRYTYTAQCSETDVVWQVPRTGEIESIARGLMQCLVTAPEYLSEGNLYGVLLVQTATGDKGVLKGFSGVMDGRGQVSGWVPPLSNQARIALIEDQTLATLDQLKRELIILDQLPIRMTYQQVLQGYEVQVKQLKVRHRKRKLGRDRKRTHYYSTLQGDTLTNALNELKRESQQDSLERRRLKQERDRALASLIEEITQVDQQIQKLKQQYSTLSRQWQAQMQVAYATERLGEGEVLLERAIDSGIFSSSLEQVCQRAAAKLLHYAVTHALQPLAMAEFWWGEPKEDFYTGQFYGASPKDCQILMRIARMPVKLILVAETVPLPILYQDDAIIVVDKPAGLLSVPGRRHDLQDSVLSRLRYQLPDYDFLQVVHRLDQATSGILVLAKSPSAHKELGRQFAKHQVHKTYEAILSRPIGKTAGVIDLPLWGNPDERPKQSVNIEYGKPSVTHFEVLQTGNHPRVKFMPQTGRTHQLRVHAASPQGLNSPILGDSLYGEVNQTKRLHLHATSLQFIHPVTQKRLQFRCELQF